MASVRKYAKAYAQTMILGGAALIFSGCEITRQFDRDIPRIDGNHAGSYAAMGAGDTGQGPLPPGPAYRPTPANTVDVPAEIVDLDEVLAEIMKRRQTDAQRRLNAEADDPLNARNPANWLRSTRPKDPPNYLNEEQIQPFKRYTDKVWF